MSSSINSSRSISKSYLHKSYFKPSSKSFLNERDEPILEAPFDLTEERLRHLFSTFDTDSDGRVDYDSLKCGLEEWKKQAGMVVSAFEENAFSSFTSTLDPDLSHDLSFEEFSQGFRSFILQALLSVEDESAPLEVLDYDATRLIRSDVGIPSSPTSLTAENFFFKKRGDWVNVRWIDVITNSSTKKGNELTMKRLAAKYLLHPLALEDTLETNVVHRAKIEAFSSHYFLIIPLFSLYDVACSKSADNPRWYKKLTGKDPKYYQKVNTEMVSIFLDVENNKTVITCANGSIFGESMCGARKQYWEHVESQLEKPYSKLRQYDAQYLVYSLLDASVETLFPITKVIRKELDNQKDILIRTNYRTLFRIRDIQRNLEKVCHTIKPFLRVLTHIIEDDAICAGVTCYIRDVLDNLELAEDEFRQLIELCVSLDSDADKFQDSQMNRTLYILTVVSAIFLPAQFLTGLWGMNFIDMPELEKSWGYEMFWIVALILTVSVFVLFCTFGRIRMMED